MNNRALVRFIGGPAAGTGSVPADEDGHPPEEHLITVYGSTGSGVHLYRLAASPPEGSDRWLYVHESLFPSPGGTYGT